MLKELGPVLMSLVASTLFRQNSSNVGETTYTRLEHSLALPVASSKPTHVESPKILQKHKNRKPQPEFFSSFFSQHNFFRHRFFEFVS